VEHVSRNWPSRIDRREAFRNAILAGRWELASAFMHGQRQVAQILLFLAKLE